MCKRLFQALKIKMDNYVLRYELAGADETVEVLRKQLTEKKEQLKIALEDFNSIQNENDSLLQQLSEKEKEVEDLKAQRHIYLNRSVDECNKITDLEFELQHKDQDKISFCIEQLEKVKEKLNELFENEHGCAIITDVLDNQIEELKKEMK